MVLEYFTQTDKLTVYDIGKTYAIFGRPEMTKVSLDEFRQFVSSRAKNVCINDVCAVVSTRLPLSVKGWFGLGVRQHIMVLDCDDLESMYAATRVLKRDGIRWAGIESSPDHFWIITDKVGAFRRLFPVLAAIPGVDRKYVEFAKERKCFCLRGIRKSKSKPGFGTTENLRDPRVIDWFNSFKALHDDPIIIENLSLIQHLKNGTLAGVAADPDFDV